MFFSVFDSALAVHLVVPFSPEKLPAISIRLQSFWLCFAGAHDHFWRDAGLSSFGYFDWQVPFLDPMYTLVVVFRKASGHWISPTKRTKPRTDSCLHGILAKLFVLVLRQLGW